MWDGSSWLKWRSMALFVRLCLPSISVLLGWGRVGWWGGLTPAFSLQVRSRPPSLSSSSSSLPLTFLSLSSSIAAQISRGSRAGSELFVKEPEGRNLSSSGLTTSSNMVWLVVNGCSGSHCAVVWNRWWSRCCWCLAARSVWEVFDTNEASSSQKTKNRWCRKMRHLSEAFKPRHPPASDDPPHTSLSFSLLAVFFPSCSLSLSLSISLFYINEPFLPAKTISEYLLLLIQVAFLQS